MTRIGVWLTTVGAVLVLVVGGLVVAPVSATIQVLCKGVSTADVKTCNPAYAAEMWKMHWRMYAGHNCTNFVAYQLGKNGVPEPKILMGNARDWIGNAKKIGYKVDSTPQVGSVGAWSGRNHVTYVVAVGSNYIITHEDNFPGYYPKGLYQELKIYKGDSSYPTSFIHFKDLVTGSVPKVSGTTKVGSTLTASIGTWTPSGLSISYQWLRDGTAVSGATNSKHVLVAADLGHAMSVRVTGAKSGFATLRKTSAKTAAIAHGTITASATPVISGTVQVGKDLAIDAGTWSPSTVSLSYQWLRDSVPITGATGTSYGLTPDDLGGKISVKVTGAKAGYTTLAKTSSQTVDVAPGTLVNSAAPTITGSAKTLATLTGHDGTWAPAGTALHRQWLADGTAIAGATGATYVPVRADIGKRISFRVTGTKPGYTTLVKTSEPTAEVVASVISNTIAPKITGTAKVGVALTADSGTWSPTGTTEVFQWLVNGVAVSGATTDTFTPRPADLSKKVSVKVTSSKSGLASVSKTSAPTALVVAGTMVNTVPPSISGTPAVGAKLTALIGTWIPAGQLHTYQWYAEGVAISGATAKTFVPTNAQKGKTLTVHVRSVTAGYAPRAASSAPSAPVLTGFVANSAAPVLSGSSLVGSTLRTSNGSWSPTDAAFAYQWLRNGVPIDSDRAREQSYVVTGWDLGKSLSARVTGSKASYAPFSATSDGSAAVKVKPTVSVTVTPGRSQVAFAIVVGASGVTPTGTVKIMNGTRYLKTLTLVGGKASVTFKYQKRGSYTDSFAYSGDSKVVGLTVTRKFSIS